MVYYSNTRNISIEKDNNMITRYGTISRYGIPHNAECDKCGEEY